MVPSVKASADRGPMLSNRDSQLTGARPSVRVPTGDDFMDPWRWQGPRASLWALAWLLIRLSVL